MGHLECVSTLRALFVADYGAPAGCFIGRVFEICTEQDSQVWVKFRPKDHGHVIRVWGYHSSFHRLRRWNESGQGLVGLLKGTVRRRERHDTGMQPPISIIPAPKLSLGERKLEPAAAGPFSALPCRQFGQDLREFVHAGQEVFVRTLNLG